MLPYVTTLLSFTAGALDKFRSACVKCRYTESYSVTAMLTELNLYKFDSLVDKCRSDFQRQIHACGNGIVQHFVWLHLMWLMLLLFCFCFFYCFDVVLWAHAWNKERWIDWLIKTIIENLSNTYRSRFRQTCLHSHPLHHRAKSRKYRDLSWDIGTRPQCTLYSHIENALKGTR